MTFEIGSATDIGRRRSGNEDALEVLELADADGVLCIVADGMGGHQAGEVASRLAVETIRQALHGKSGPSIDQLVAAIQAANRMVYDESTVDLAKQGMGTTVVCALLGAGRAVLANVGDSPAFLVRGRQAERRTRDHSWVGEEIERGVISPEEAAGHPYRHILTRCLGMADDVEIEVYPSLDLAPGDVLVLCSDGLSEHVPPEDLPAVVVVDRPAQAIAEALVALANERGGSDNITVIVARWLASDHSP